MQGEGGGMVAWGLGGASVPGSFSARVNSRLGGGGLLPWLPAGASVCSYAGWPWCLVTSNPSPPTPCRCAPASGSLTLTTTGRQP